MTVDREALAQRLHDAYMLMDARNSGLELWSIQPRYIRDGWLAVADEAVRAAATLICSPCSLGRRLSVRDGLYWHGIQLCKAGLLHERLAAPEGDRT